MLKAGALLACGGAIGAAGVRRALAVESQAPLAELRYAQVKFEPGPVERQARENRQLVLSLDGLSSAAQAYLELGQRPYFDAARQGFDFIDAAGGRTGARA